ncbi:hypothetical protein BDZ88DRAFT_418688 [Geranomyces variabilis]|nr:hypothetical protein BDZ88DRAFT_418688 [Geranomyces variabilis]
MCYGIEVLLWDILVVIGLILLVIWILDIAHGKPAAPHSRFSAHCLSFLESNLSLFLFCLAVWNVATGPWKHAFLVVGVLFLIMWVLVRCCCGGRRKGRRNAVIV